MNIYETLRRCSQKAMEIVALSAIDFCYIPKEDKEKVAKHSLAECESEKKQALSK